jgi:hypothetical protein
MLKSMRLIGKCGAYWGEDERTEIFGWKNWRKEATSQT